MTIDGCGRSFDEIARFVLPAYMVQLRERIQSPYNMSDFAVKGVGPVTMQTKLGLDHDPRGCYVLLDQDQPVYVGISKHIIARIMEHVRGTDHLSATLAYKIAKKHHPHNTTAAKAIKDPQFLLYFEDARKYLLSLNVVFVEIDNPLELYLFEPYCAMELDTGFEAGGWNTFETH